MTGEIKAKGWNIDPEIMPSILMIALSVLALLIVNSPLQYMYDEFFHHAYIFGEISWHVFVNDFLMAIFFLSVTLEIKKEIMDGSLSSIKKASFPIIGAIGGVVVPALIFWVINQETVFLKGIGIPISTDIAFAIGIFMLFKNKLNPQLKVFLLSLAVVDDLISIAVIGLLYTAQLQISYLIGGLLIIGVLVGLDKFYGISKKSIYLLGGVLLWYFIYKSGVHATMSGVLLGAIIPYKHKKGEHSMAEELEHKMSGIVNMGVLPLFAFANMGIVMNFSGHVQQSGYLITSIVIALVIGKPLGILLFTYVGDKIGITEKPKEVGWLCVLNTAIFAGIGFTMAIFVSEIAFNTNDQVINLAKLAVILAGIITITIIYGLTTFLYNTNLKIGEFGCNHKNKDCRFN